ncbi:MAG: RNA-binding S4 domain-containing protein [Tissierellia bacterium]|nr:RNA-binding S4 domain-containing protein [Tissierellia bacterium]
MRKIKINTDTIKLDQLLKFAGIVQTGGQGKMLIKDGLVKVNGSTIKARGKNIKKGDIIEIEDIDKFVVI